MHVAGTGQVGEAQIADDHARHSDGRHELQAAIFEAHPVHGGIGQAYSEGDHAGAEAEEHLQLIKRSADSGRLQHFNADPGRNAARKDEENGAYPAQALQGDIWAGMVNSGHAKSS